MAPNGDDSAPGTLSAPFATLDRARAAIGTFKANNPSRTNPITVLIRGGTYYLTTPLNFTAADSGAVSLPILYSAYPGETPVVSGGVPITGWQQTQPGVWTANLPSTIANFEQLFVNGQRRYRPRTTKSGYLYNAGPVFVPAPEPGCPSSVQVAGKGYQCFDRFQFKPGDLEASYYDMNDVELDDFEKWDVSKLRLKSVDAVNRIAFLTGPTSQDAQGNHGWLPGHRYLVENVKESLNQTGEWYLDRLASPHTLTYLAKPGEDLTVLPVVAPQLPQILISTGLEYVTFRGLTFSHDNWTVPAAGHPSTQGEPLVSAALSFTGSSNVVFDSCIFAHIGGFGIEFTGAAQGSGPQGNRIANSMFYDIGVTGIRIGQTQRTTDTDANVAQNNLIENNVLAGGGRVLAGGIAIWQGDSHNNTYTHNDILDWYHSGFEICLPTPAGCANAHDVEVSFNHIWQIGQGVTSDMGGVYVATYSNVNNRVLNNRIHDVTHDYRDPDGYGGWGIYFDNQTSGATAQNNLVYRASQATYFNNQGTNNTFMNNILAYPRNGAVQRGMTSVAGTSFRFTHNVVYFQSAVQTLGNWTCTDLSGAVVPCTQEYFFDANVYWNPTSANLVFRTSKPGAPSQYNLYNFAQWQQTAGEDVNSIVADPLFVNPTYPADDFRLQPASPALQKGILQAFDPTQAGRSNPILYPPPLEPAWPLQLLDPVKDYGEPATAANILTNANAADYATGSLAPDSIVTAKGTNFAAGAQSAQPPLPTQLNGASIAVRDNAGASRPALLYYASQGQLNYVMPSGTAAGPATITAMGPNNAVSTGTAIIAPVAPGLFSADATGMGLAAANVLYYHADGTVTATTAETPVNLSNASEQVILVLYGTGIRNRSSLAAADVKFGGRTLPALYAGSQPQYPGLDQVNVQLPQNLAGSGTVNVILTVDGVTANTLSIAIQ